MVGGCTWLSLAPLLVNQLRHLTGRSTASSPAARSIERQSVQAQVVTLANTSRLPMAIPVWRRMAYAVET